MQSNALKGRLIPIRNFEIASYVRSDSLICENCYATKIPAGDRILYSCFIMRTTEFSPEALIKQTCSVCTNEIVGKLLPVIEITKGDKNIITLDHTAANIYISSDKKYSQIAINAKNKKLMDHANSRFRNRTQLPLEFVNVNENNVVKQESDETEIKEILLKEIRQVSSNNLYTIEDVLINYFSSQSN